MVPNRELVRARAMPRIAVFIVAFSFAAIHGGF
jgi:hypothetical protein